MIYNKYSYSIVLLIISLLIAGCSINRYKNNLKVGKWIETHDIEGITYKRVEFYKRGKEKGTWKVYAGKTLERKEKYKRDTCYTTIYYPNGTLSSKGKSIIRKEDDDSLHWFYTGDWKYFNKAGKLEFTRNYVNGMETMEIEVKK
ncbi:hypothetical protein SAMN06265348_1252 [Pedobacter westerhofensis]|uniref:MORN repeat variant n=1 Tax=Pedobacter westerhofensis TaxID=425512 RepID=A0A521FUA5_9SPHI|nr:hypothetical protein [Pedobacter westerhofensis]SMO99692.1 hypothetical protein SAMN06265348_1252 [Pedobacter westerhofensis]